MTNDSLIKKILFDLRLNWRLLVIILTPIILCPLPIVARASAASCAYVVLIMVVFWMTEVVPLPVTALIPLVLFPLFGVMNASSVANVYLKDSNWVFFGSLMMALAVEQSQLHHRVGLLTLIKIGSSPRRLMLGFMISTCFLSMWMSNTATTAMMVPLALAVIEKLMETMPDEKGSKKAEDQTVCGLELSNTAATVDEISAKSETKIEAKLDLASIAEAVRNHGSAKFQRICKGLLLSICYAANIGGTGTLTGTSTNLVLVGQLDSIYRSKDTGLTFASWMAFSLPQMVVILILAWLWLQTVYIGFGGCTKKADTTESAIEAILKKKYDDLNPMTFAEKATLVMFVLLIVAWLFRKPGFIPGWGDLFLSGYVTDGTASMIIGLLLFFIPSEMPKLALFSKNSRQYSNLRAPPSLLTWDVMQKEFPWGIVILVGGGYAMAAGVQNSGLDAWISLALSHLHALPIFAFVVISVIMVTFITEFSSNAAIASIVIPIGASVAYDMHVNPLYIVLPVTVACSFAFMLPVATPPNAIVFSAGLLRVTDMALAGFVMNIICMVILLININTYGCWLFQCSTFPAWAEKGGNSSAIVIKQDFNATYF